MRTLQYLSEGKQMRIAKETLEVYAPLAERLGMGEIKGQLEDLAFPFVYPKEFKKVSNKSKLYYKKVEQQIKKMRRSILKELYEHDKKVNVHGREKHLYSLWIKLKRPEIDWDFEKINDIVAMRILVSSVTNCYMSLGAVHSLYKPVPNIGVSDFIAQPKPNGYRSIHTKVFGYGDRIVEVQIRTFEMHEQAEYGVAAHWAYGAAKTSGAKDSVLESEGASVSDKLTWVKQLGDWQKEITDSDEYLEAVKFDALSQRNFIFSPKGDVFDLPAGATPVDFAYAVHTNLGNYIKGAKADGKIVPLSYKLKSGQVCEILKNKKPRKANRDWLRFVVTNQAKKKIKKNFRN